jgi:hypothetical protein
MLGAQERNCQKIISKVTLKFSGTHPKTETWQQADCCLFAQFNSAPPSRTGDLKALEIIAMRAEPGRGRGS